MKRLRLLLVMVLTEAMLFLVIFAIGRTLADRGASMVVMGLIGGGFGVSSAISSVVFGRWSDRTGRLRVISVGIIVGFVCVGLAYLGIVYHIGWMVASYLVMGVAAGATYPTIAAWLNDGGADEANISVMLRVLMGFCVAWNLGIIVGQTAGGWLYQSISATAPLWLAGVFLLINGVLVWLPMPRETRAMVEIDDAMAAEVRNRHRASGAFSQLCWIANVSGTFAMSIIINFLPVLMVELQIDPNRHGMIFASSRFVVIGVYLLMFASRFWHYRFLTTVGVHVVGVGGLLVLVFANGAWGLLLGLVGLSVILGHNYFASLYYSATRGGDEARGSAMGLHEATLSAGMAGGAVFGGVLGTYAGTRAPYLLAAAVVASSIGVQAVMWWRFRSAVEV